MMVEVVDKEEGMLIRAIRMQMQKEKESKEIRHH